MQTDPVQFGSEHIAVYYDPCTHMVQVTESGHTWQTDPNGMVIEYQLDGHTHQVPFTAARRVRIRPVCSGVGQGIEVDWEDFAFDGGQLALTTCWWLEPAEEVLHAAMTVRRESGVPLVRVIWPAPFQFDSPLAQDYTVAPLMQGVLIPNDSKQTFDLDSRWELEAGHYYTRSAYMPWWGQVEAGSGYMAVALTPWDGGPLLSHPAGGPTRMCAAWYPSLGKLRYTRIMAYRFRTPWDYVGMCKEYRTLLRRAGRLRTLKEKQLTVPVLERLYGCAVIHTCAQMTPHSDCRFYGTPDAPACDETFAHRAAQLERLYHLGLERAYVHLDGWTREGYDSQHPDVWPPNERAGGAEGLRALQDTVRRQGWLFALHDQYRDYYLDAPSYTPALAKKEADGNIPICDYWVGGKQAFLCPSQAPAFLRRNYELLQENGLQPDGAYLDVFACVGLDECFDPRHPVTREDCMRLRDACFAEIRSRGMIVSSEEGIGWAMHTLDLVHHANYAMVMEPDPSTLCGRPTGKAYGVCVPLLNLVYHDCVVTPWYITEKDSEMPHGQSGLLHALLNGGVPYLRIDAEPEEIETAQIVAKLHQRVACAEMINHEFLDKNPLWQRTKFSDGTQVTVRFDRNEWEILPPL